MTDENLKACFEAARDVVVSANVAKINPSYDPNVALSEDFIIIHAERINGYDETQMEIDCGNVTANSRHRDRVKQLIAKRL